MIGIIKSKAALEPRIYMNSFDTPSYITPSGNIPVPFVPIMKVRKV